jgi:ATP adenylyltransferase
MKKIYAPWRDNYVSNTTRNGDREKMKNDCVFCHQFKTHKDEKYLIVKRYNHCAIVLNKYPYNSGHLMILPFEHKAELNELNKETRAEMMEVVNYAIEALKKTMKPHGFNVGINLGIAGGGGLPSHLHIHILPRWNGDTNFLATIGDTKIVCTPFEKVYKVLKESL